MGLELLLQLFLREILFCSRQYAYKRKILYDVHDLQAFYTEIYISKNPPPSILLKNFAPLISGKGYHTPLWFDVVLKQVSAEGTGGVVGGREPLVEAGRVELLLAGPAAQLRQLVVRPVQDVEADVALLQI